MGNNDLAIENKLWVRYIAVKNLQMYKGFDFCMCAPSKALRNSNM